MPRIDRHACEQIQLLILEKNVAQSNNYAPLPRAASTTFSSFTIEAIKLDLRLSAGLRCSSVLSVMVN